jgi:hypothetical protein
MGHQGVGLSRRLVVGSMIRLEKRSEEWDRPTRQVARQGAHAWACRAFFFHFLYASFKFKKDNIQFSIKYNPSILNYKLF